MQGGVLLETLLPISLFIIMLGMGLSLTKVDFSRVVSYPKAVIVGLLAQFLVLPIIGFIVATVFGLEPLLAVGLMILSFCPSGSTANLYSYLFKGDVALSLTLTALVSVIKPFTLPFLAYYAMVHFMGEGRAIELPILKTVLQLFVITVLPVGIGMAIRHFSVRIATKSEKPIKVFSLIVLFVIIGGLVMQNWERMYGFFAQTGIAAFALNVISIAAGFALGKVLSLTKAQSITIAFELGIQNGTTALLVTGTILKEPMMTIVPVTYSLLMFVTALLFGLVMGRSRKESTIVDGVPSKSTT